MYGGREGRIERDRGETPRKTEERHPPDAGWGDPESEQQLPGVGSPEALQQGSGGVPTWGDSGVVVRVCF